MTSVAITIGLGYLALFLWPVAAFIAGWRQSRKGYVAAMIAGVVLMAFWIWAVVGVSPFQPSAMMSQVSVLLLGSSAFAVGWLVARWFRKDKKAPSTGDKA